MGKFRHGHELHAIMGFVLGERGNEGRFIVSG